ncbi:MAG: hypothetical protein AAB512_03145 [Patescibacteria group bacterium]
MIFNGNVVVFANAEELKIGLFHSLLRRRDTLYVGLISFRQALTIVQDKVGFLPPVTVSYTNKRTAEFAEKLLGMKVEAVERPNLRPLYTVSGDTRQLKDSVDTMISNERRAKRLRKKALI